VATGATTSSGHAEPNAGLAKVKPQEAQSASLPMRPAPVKSTTYPSRYTGAQGGTGCTADWVNSEAGRVYLAKHKLQLPPTQLLSLECQKRKFNPDFVVEQVDGRMYKCQVTIRDVIVKHRGHYQNGVAAKQDVALKALKEVQKWPIPPTNLYFVAQFSGEVSDDAVHHSLRQVLKGRKYTLSTLRYPGLSRGYFLLQIPEYQGFPTSIIRLNGMHNSVVFANIKKTDHCNLCAKTNSTPHSRVCCPLWRHSPAPPVKLEYGGHKQSFPQRPVKTESKYYNPAGNHDSTVVKHVVGSVAMHDQLIRSIQNATGTAAMSSESQDPRVKLAFLEGIALGARLAATAPGNGTNGERRRSRSPGGREPRGSDYWPPPGYRARSPLAPIRDRHRSREPMIDHGVEPRHAGGYDGSVRGRRRSPEPYVGQGASHWSNDMYFR
jgi:hypothetical protein